MLSKFSVSNYKSFEKKITLDFKSGNFNFSQDAISKDNHLVKAALIFGKNGTGKSNLGYAIFDIVTHLTDNNTNKEQKENIINLNSTSKVSSFEYEFILLNKRIIYHYTKDAKQELVIESLWINDESILYINRTKAGQAIINLAGTETLITEVSNISKVSIVNYVKNNAVLDKRNATNKAFYEFVNFVNQMLYFRCLRENAYIGYQSGSATIPVEIIKKNKLKDFETFLNEAGVACQLVPLKTATETTIAFKFENGVREFFSIASTGTIALSVFYFWLIEMEENKYPFFIFIDEFDAFYHHTLSTLIVKRLKSLNKQIVCTTHNSDIMTNDLLRPDCYYILTNNSLNPITRCTERELREAHNLAKLYKSGALDCE